MGKHQAMLDLAAHLPASMRAPIDLAFVRCHWGRGWWLVVTWVVTPLAVAAGFMLAGWASLLGILITLLVLALANGVVLWLARATFARKHLQVTTSEEGGQASVRVTYPVRRFEELVASGSKKRFWLTGVTSFLLIGCPLLVLLAWQVHTHVGPGGLVSSEPRILQGRVLSHLGFWVPGPTERIPKVFQGYLREGLVPQGTLAASRGLSLCCFPTDSDEGVVSDPPLPGTAEYLDWIQARFEWALKARNVVGEVTLSFDAERSVRQGDLFHIIGQGTVKGTVLVHRLIGPGSCAALPVTLVAFQSIVPGDLAIRIQQET